jgi:hypothetical protein
MIIEALREYLSKSGKPLDETVIRRQFGKNWIGLPITDMFKEVNDVVSNTASAVYQQSTAARGIAANVA